MYGGVGFKSERRQSVIGLRDFPLPFPYRCLIAGWERYPRIVLEMDRQYGLEPHPHYRVIVNEEDQDGSLSLPTRGLTVLPQGRLDR